MLAKSVIFRYKYLLHQFKLSNNRWKASGTVAELLNKKVSVVKFDSVVGSLKSATEKYEDFTGVTDLKKVQQQVLDAEQEFLKTQQHRHDKQIEIQNLQIRLRDIHLDLDKTSRGDDRYLHLLTQEHALIKQEKCLLDDLRRLSRSERYCFDSFSNRLRESHEKERARAERTKYMSALGSIFGVIGGFLLASVGNRFKMNDLKKVVEDSTNDTNVQQSFHQLSNLLQNQQRQTTNFILDLKTMLNDTSQTSLTTVSTIQKEQRQSEEILRDWMSPQQSLVIKTALDEHNNKLALEMDEIKKLIASERGYKVDGDGSVVYMGPEFQSLLDKTEKNIETKLRLTTLLGVVLVYGALALTVPVFVALLRGAA